MQNIWRGYNLAQEKYSSFNICNWYFLKYEMWQFGRFSKMRSRVKVYLEDGRPTHLQKTSWEEKT